MPKPSKPPLSPALTLVDFKVVLNVDLPMPERNPASKMLTIAEVKSCLELLSLPVPGRDGLAAIRRLEGDRFVETLQAAASQARQDSAPDQSRLEYLANIVTAVHEDTRVIAEESGYQADVALLMNVAKGEGGSFREAVRMARTGSSQGDIDAARSYLSDLLDQYGALPLELLGLGDNAPTIEFEQPGMSSPRENIKEQGSSSAKEALSQTTEPLPSSHVGEVKKFGESVRVFAGKAALCVSETTTPVGDKHTVTFEVAQIQEGGRANWSNKVSLMLTVPEQVLVLGVLRGFMPQVELKGHGSMHDKAMTIVNQGHQFFLTMIKRGQAPRALPIPAAYAYPIITMLLRQMGKNDNHLNCDVIERISEQLCEMHGRPPKMEPKNV